MKNIVFRRARTAAIAVLIAVLAATTAASDEAVTLKAIMQDLRNDLVKVSDGLLRDDFALMAQGARGIAEHPRIPADQVKLVAAELGEEMPVFKQLDMRVHDLSLRLKSAAGAADRDVALSSYLKLVEGCIACHVSYKERVAAALDAGAED